MVRSQHRIQPIIIFHLDLRALANTTTGKKEPLNSHIASSLIIGLRRSGIIQVIDRLGDLLPLPTLSTIAAVIASHTLRMAQILRIPIGTIRLLRTSHLHIRTAIAHLTGSADQQKLAGFPIAHYRRIAMSFVKARFPFTFDRYRSRCPTTSAIRALTHQHTDISHRTDVAPSRGIGHAGTVVAKEPQGITM